ncbi:MAG: helix-turn-helix transcriptional regulator [Mycobacterium sp.]
MVKDYDRRNTLHRGAAMVTIEQFSQMVTAVHASAITDDGWAAAMSLVTGALNSTGAGLVIGCGDERNVDMCFIPVEAKQTYQQHYRQVDYVLDAVDRGPLGLVHSGAHLVDLNPRSEFNQGWIRPHDMDDGLFVRVPAAPVPCMFMVVTDKRSTPFATADNVTLVNALVPHVRQALRTQQVLNALQNRDHGRVHAVDATTAAAVLVAPDMTVQHLNGAAESLLRSGDEIQANGGRLGLRRPAENTRLRRAVAAATGGSDTGTQISDSLLVRRTADPGPLVVHVTPFPGHGGPCALIVIVDPGKVPEPSPEMLRRLFGLTAAEAAVALSIGRGAGLAAVADELCLTLATVKTHLQHIYAKTSTHRQAELVRLLLAVTP